LTRSVISVGAIVGIALPIAKTTGAIGRYAAGATVSASPLAQTAHHAELPPTPALARRDERPAATAVPRSAAAVAPSVHDSDHDQGSRHH